MGRAVVAFGPMGLVGLALVTLVTLVGCSSGGTAGSDPDDGAVAATTVAVDAATTAYCEVLTALPDEVPESYVGSDANLADVESLLAVAPAVIRPQLATYRAYVASGAITADPRTKDIENFPPDVRLAAEELEAFGTANC